MELMTERLLLRDMIPGDIEKTVRDLSNMDTKKYMISIPHPYTKEHAERFLELCNLESNENPRTQYDLRIVIKETGEVMGGIRLSNINNEKMSTVGYWIAVDKLKMGYGSEAAGRMIQFAFEEKGLSEIGAKTSTENEGSRRLLEKLGFKLVEIIPNGRKISSTGKIQDEAIYLLKKE